MIPGWPYSVIAALEPGRTCWAAALDAVRLGPDDDETEVTAAQVHDAGYDVTRLAWLLADLPVELLGRLRSDRVMWLPTPPRQPGHHGPPPQARLRAGPRGPGGMPRPAGHHHHADLPVRDRGAAAWDRVHPRLTHRAAWLDHHRAPHHG